jgi:hypothetical protein
VFFSNCSDGRFADRLRAALERGNTPDTDSVNDDGADDDGKKSGAPGQKGFIKWGPAVVQRKRDVKINCNQKDPGFAPQCNEKTT